ncbi:MAG: efflux RND transporter periplasmic adaptor subunit [Alphaproteobacteria bacterium]
MNDVETRPPVGTDGPQPMTERRKSGWIGILAVVLVLVGLAGGGTWYITNDPSGGVPAGPPPGSFAAPVEAGAVRLGTVVIDVAAVGSLRSNESVWIAPEIAGRVEDIPAQEGADVEAGAPVVALDARIYRAELAQAEASLALSEQNHRRAEELVANGAGTQRALDEARASLAHDRAAVDLAKARLEKTRIAAPFAGVLGMRRVSAGAYVSPGDPIINLEQIDPLKIDFRVPESALSAVAPGGSIEITVDALPGRSFGGTIYAVDPLVDEAGRSVVVRARVPNPDRALRPGLFARVAVIVERRDDAVLVPERAIVPFGEDSYVFRVVDGAAKLTKVVLGQRQDGEVEIREGLGAGDVVITDGLLKIGDGAPVAVVEPPAS